METRQCILDASIDLFSQRGFHAVSIREITRQVGIKESTLYYHFRNKEDILQSIFTMYKDAYMKIFPPENELEELLSRTSPAVFLKQGMDNYKKYIMNHPRMTKLSRIIHIEQFGHSTARKIMLHDVINRSINFLEMAFIIMIKRGSIRNLEPRSLAYEYQYPVFAMYLEYQIVVFDGGDTSHLERLLNEHVDRFIERIKR